MNEWHNRHDTCPRADRRTPTQADGRSLKSTQPKQVPPRQSTQWNKGDLQKARHRHRATRQGTSLEVATQHLWLAF